MAPAASVSDADLQARHKALREQIRALVGDLERAGRYDCCIEAPCSTCALRMGGCKCGEGLRRGEPVCEECAMMWRSGRGAEAGVDPASVVSFLEAETAMKGGYTPAAGGGPERGVTEAPVELAPVKAEAAGCTCPGHAK